MNDYLLDTNHAGRLIDPRHAVRARVAAAQRDGQAFYIIVPVITETVYGFSVLPRAARNQLQWQLVITPSEVKVYLHTSSDGDIVPALTVDGRQFDEAGGAAPPMNGEWSYVFDAPLYDAHGTWTVTVLTDPRTVNGYRSFTGHVTFQVTVP